MTFATTRALVWDENQDGVPERIYPRGIRETIAEGLREFGVEAKTACLDENGQGLTPEALDNADALVYWAHARHAEVSDDAVRRVVERVSAGRLGLVMLHSAMTSKLMRTLLGCTGASKGGWDHDPQPEEIRVCAPRHPIADGVRDFTIAEEEYYGAPAQFPPPEVVVYQSYFSKYQRYYPSGLCWTVGEGIVAIEGSGRGGGKGQGVGAGRVFYFRPGHEACPTFHLPAVRRIVFNAVRWAAAPRRS